MRVGIFGGTFNPIHYGHIYMAKRVKAEFGLDVVYFMVDNLPPHKTVAQDVSGQMRYDMCVAALERFSATDSIYVSDYELRSAKETSAVSYTVDTLSGLKEIHPEDEMFLIVGADMLYDLPNWKLPKEILRLAEIIAVRRPGVEENSDIVEVAKRTERDYGGKIYVTDFSGDDISSTQVRQCVFDARPIDKYVPYSCERFIYENALYMPQKLQEIIADLKQRLTPRRFTHSVSAMREAIQLGMYYGVDTQKCRLAALLHDCAKVANANYVKDAEQFGLPIDKYSYATPGLLHSPLGAYMARERYGVTDVEVLAAIKNHTLCAVGMTDVEKITYIADKIEAMRDYPGVGKLRRAAYSGLDNGVIACIEFAESTLKASSTGLHPQTIAAKEWLLTKNNG